MKKLLIIIFTALLSSAVYAATDTTEDFIKEMEKKQSEAQRKAFERDMQNQKKELPDLSDQPLYQGAQHRFYINKLIIHNDDLLSGSEREHFNEKYTARELSYNDLTLLTRELTNLLINKGYSTTRVQIPVGQNISKGTLEIEIIKGFIEEIVPAENTFRNRMKIRDAFPFFKGRLLNISDIDLGLERLNGVPSGNAKMEIRPGSENGLSRIVISDEGGLPFTLDTGFDNLGQKANGKFRGRVNAGLYNLLSINDALNCDITGSLTDQKTKYSRSLTAMYAFPLGRWSFSGIFSRSENLQTVEGEYRGIESKGLDTSGVFSIDRLMLKTKGNSRLKIRTKLTVKNKENYIEDAKIETSSIKLTVVNVGIDFTSFLAGGYFSASASCHRGLPVLGAYKDPAGLDRNSARAQFTKTDLNLFWNRMFRLFVLPFTFSAAVTGQYSFDALYSSEKLSAGDFSTVRGFSEGSITGDRGFYSRNDLALDLSFIWKELQGISVYGGFDYGYIIDKAGKDSNYGQGEASLIGWCTGINVGTKILSGNFTYARKIFQPWFLDEDDHVFYMSASLSFSGLTSVITGI